jgi:UDP-galactopyranose mutase
LGLNREGVFITYAGSIDERIDFTTLKEACRVLSAKKYNVKLLLAGSASQNGIQGCEFIIYLGNLPFAQVPTLLSASDILVLPYNESPLSVTANPCKVPEYLASQRPIVFSKTTNIEFPLKISDEQLYVAGSVKSLIAAIEWCLENKPICSYQEDFSWLNQSKALVEFVESKRIDKCLYQS